MFEDITHYPTTIACKVCAAEADICGVVDISRCGADMIAGNKVDPFVGVPIYYYACRQCGFTCTPAFDHWTHDDFARHVYNDDYVRHDPEYLEHRPQQHADLICTSFPEMRDGRILDFGSGLGLLERKLSARGFGDVTSYDPFSQAVAPHGTFDAVLSFEVFEHHPQPRRLFADIVRYRGVAGALLFQTSLITPEIRARGIEQWWYCVPRNGHISFYTSAALTLLATSTGSNWDRSARNCTWCSIARPRRGGCRSSSERCGAQRATWRPRSYRNPPPLRPCYAWLSESSRFTDSSARARAH